MRPANTLQRHLLAAIAATVSLSAPEFAYCQGIPGYPNSIYAFDPREVAMLPRYCIHTQHFREQVPGGSDPDQIKRWSSVMGDTFIHMHHYCYGLMDFNRATLLAREPHVRKHYLQNAINEFDYVLKEAPQSFVLLPEILAKKGETLLRQGRGALAVGPLERAMELRPDYWPPYAHLSDYYKDAGDLKSAREVLERGLSNSPDAKGLQRRLAELNAEPGKRKSSPSPDRKQGTAPGR